jgi:hypothetical protein
MDVPLSDPEQWALIQAQVQQSMVEHQIVAQALRAQSIVSCAFCLALSLLSFWMWRRSVACAEALLAQEKRSTIEQRERDAKHATAMIDMQRQHGLELDSITRTSLRELVELVTKR